MKIIYYALFIVLIFNSFACVSDTQSQKIFNQGNITNLQTNIDFEAEKYKVYSTLIRSDQTSQHFGLSVKDVDNLVINEETIACGSDVVSEKVKNMRAKIENGAVSDLNISSDLLNDYHIRNKTCTRVLEKLNLPVKYTFLNNRDLESFFSNKDFDGWELFYKKYQNSSGIINFSNVGFSKNGRQAFVYVTRSCGSLCGAGFYFFLVKNDNDWKVEGVSNPWVS